jgi:restriction system protein
VVAKRRESGIETIASMPWQAGIVLGAIGFAIIRYGIGWLLSASNNPVLAGMGKAGAAGSFTPVAWVFLLGCWVGAISSFFRQRYRTKLLEAQTGLDSVRAMSWRAFELLVGEAFRRQGYAVEETGLGGADGGVDLLLRKPGKTVLVQCKQWRSKQVPVTVVREMFGLLNHHNASAVILVSTGDYTADARRFAMGKPIELINGEQLLAMVQSVQTAATATHQMPSPVTTTAPRPSDDTPTCPSCESVMIRRENRRTREAFWGCPSYPRCRGTRVITQA